MSYSFLLLRTYVASNSNTTQHNTTLVYRLQWLTELTVGARFFAHVQIETGVHKGYRVFPVGKAAVDWY
jgi:hypothetical protein